MMQEFVSQVNKTIRQAIDGMHTAMPGEITGYDPVTGLASVQPMAKYRKPTGETMDYPTITGVPVVFPQSKSVTVAWPIKAGDGCLLIFGETALDYWMYGKETDTSLKFDLSNAIAIPGLLATGNAAMRTACSEGAVVIASGGTSLTVGSDGVTIAGKLVVEGEIVAASDITASRSISLASHTHTVDSGGSTSEPH